MKADKSIAKTKKSRQTAAKPPMRDVFTVICKTDLKVECVKEFKFHPVRKWRFDYAVPEYKIALEVEGGVWTGGRHTSQKVFLETLRSIIRLHLWAGVCSEQRLMTCTRKRPLI